MVTRERDRVHPNEMDPERPPPRTSRPGAGGTAAVAPPVIGAALETCERCAQTRRMCPSCVQRRRYAWSLEIEHKQSLESAGQIMGLDTERVRELVIAEQDRRELRSLRCDSIPVERTRSAIADALARDPNLSIADV